MDKFVVLSNCTARCMRRWFKYINGAYPVARRNKVV